MNLPRSIPAGPWLDHLVRHLPVAERGEDPEGVHQMRVAAAHLRVWLRLGGRRMLADDLSWLRGIADEVRDLDVALAAGGPEPFVAELRQRWSAAHDQLVRDLARPRLRALLDALRTSPPIGAERAERIARRWQQAARRRGSSLDWQRAADEELHTFRRRMRRLRYALEWTERPNKSVKRFTERLGEHNDMAVMRARAISGAWVGPQMPSLPDLDDRIAQARRVFAAEWPDMRDILQDHTTGNHKE